jgi:uncharacterized protein
MSSQPINKTTFENFLSDHALMGSRCDDCQQTYLPPRPMCPQCYGEKMSWSQLPETGKLVAFTSIYIAPTAMIEAGYGRDNPYISGIVELENGIRISAQVLGLDAAQPEKVRIGTPLKAEYIDRGQDQEVKSFLVFKAT